ncbi:MAG: DUF3084 domain-containing protein [Candidatus Riflebacteria bacterium]|nr:DUF3084 domain-containing protein [Candidatus Riflebacteria bacterium]
MIQILVLLFISGVIAYLGDQLGTYVGKKRLTVLGLRPRFTAVLVTITTGMLITLLTLITAMMLSENVRIALFSVQQLNQERAALASDVARLKSERDVLQEEMKVVQERVRIKEQELVVFRKNEPFAAVVIKGNQPRETVFSEIASFMRVVASKARARGLNVKNQDFLLEENRDDLTKMADLIVASGTEMVIGAVADENTSIGETLGKVRFLVRPNDLIFPAGQEIASIGIDGSLERGAIVKALQEFMEEINHEVVRSGMIENPLTRRFGDLSSESTLSFYDMVNQIKKLGRHLNLIAVVKEDTYAIGPLNVSFRIEEE